MKAIKLRIQKSSRPLVILLAAVVVIITTMVVANATQTITTPNAVSIPYNLAAGAFSASITPVTDKPVLVMGCCNTSTDQSVGQVSLLHNSGLGMTWVGLQSFPNAAIIQGNSIIPGTPIVSVDLHGGVNIVVGSVDTILIRNTSIHTLAGNVTLIW